MEFKAYPGRSLGRDSSWGGLTSPGGWSHAWFEIKVGAGEQVPQGPWALVQWSGLVAQGTFSLSCWGRREWRTALTKKELYLFQLSPLASSLSVLRTQTLTLGRHVLSLRALCLGCADKAPA